MKKALITDYYTKWSGSLLVVAVIASIGCRKNDNAFVEKRNEFLGLLASIKPWAITTNWSPSDWDAAFRAAAALQKTPPQDVAENLKEYSVIGKKSELFSQACVVMKIAFDLPNRSDASNHFTFCGWTDWKGYTNSDGTINLGWPLSWSAEQDNPTFVIPCDGYMGPPYEPQKEFLYLWSKYKFRNLAQFGY